MLTQRCRPRGGWPPRVFLSTRIGFELPQRAHVSQAVTGRFSPPSMRCLWIEILNEIRKSMVPTALEDVREEGSALPGLCL